MSVAQARSALHPETPSIPERVTHACVRFVPIAGLADLALITLDNGQPANRPNSFGLLGLAELEAAAEGLRERAAAGKLSAVAVTGKPGSFGAGADLNTFAATSKAATSHLFLARGKEVLAGVRSLGLPTFAFVNGLALGGGLETALFCDYRTVAASVRALGLPETYLGLVPGWGGTYHLPRLVGVENALRVIVDNPQAGNRMTTAAQALELGIVDLVIDADDDAFVEQSVAWAGQVLRGEVVPGRPDVLLDEAAWAAAVERRRPLAATLAASGAPAPAAALRLVANARTASSEDGLALEEDLCSDLIMSDRLHASLYAFDLLGHRARRPAGAWRDAVARTVAAITVLGGDEAVAPAIAFAVSSGVPVTLVAPNDGAADAARRAIESCAVALAASGCRGPADAERLRAGLTVTTGSEAIAAADVVVLVVRGAHRDDAPADLLDIGWDRIAADAVVVVVSGSSGVIDAASGRSQHPDNVVGWSQVSPSAPLVEVVRTPTTTPTALATVVALVTGQRRTAVIVGNTPGFVLDRIVAPVRHWAMAHAAAGLPRAALEDVIVRLGLPTGLAALGLAGLGEDAANADAANADAASTDATTDVGELLAELQDLLARAVAGLLAAGTVEDVRDIDVALLAGAGFPLHLGGLTPMLDLTGASERATGRRFLDRGVASVPAPGTGF